MLLQLIHNQQQSIPAFVMHFATSMCLTLSMFANHALNDFGAMPSSLIDTDNMSSFLPYHGVVQTVSSPSVIGFEASSYVYVSVSISVYTSLTIFPQNHSSSESISFLL